MRTLRILALLAALTGLLVIAPAAASAAASLHWNKAVRIEPAKNGGLNAVACPAIGLCIAVDDSGYVTTTTKPTGGSRSWARAVRIDANPLTGISCPSAKLCIAVDAAGQAVISTNPTGGAKAWGRPFRIDSTAAQGGGYAGLDGISCPSAKLCVAVDGASAGNVVTSTDPAGGARAWKLAAVGGQLTSVSCPSAGFCVAAGTQHYTSTNPTGGASAWHGTGAPSGDGLLSAVHCPSTSLCVSVGYGNTSSGLATTSANPRGGAGTWKTVAVESATPAAGTGLLDAVGCAGSGLCVAVDGADDAWSSTGPAGGTWSGGSAIRPKSASSSTAVSCTRSFCVVVDSAGVETTGVVRG
jgi:hypothetical protein